MSTFTATTKSAEGTYTNASRAPSFMAGDILPGLIAPYLSASSGANFISLGSKSSNGTFTNITKN